MKKSDDTQGKLPPWTQNLLHELIDRVQENPDITVLDFLLDIGVVTLERESNDEAGATEDSQSQPEQTFEEAIAIAVDEPAVPRVTAITEPAAPRFSDLMSSPQPAQSTFSWSNWYQDNAINLLLYLGAFLIVAAVTLFVGFQWQNLDSVTRFVIVILFTVAWYGAGFISHRFQGLELAGVTFITIGAVLTPFCGVAYQRFILGTMNGVGWTWLITSIVSTAIYLGLSFGYHRRYFTYFGNLSILAMVLALVQINDAPQEYFILAGCVTALILLLGRIALRSAPRLDIYFGEDVENSSLGILLISVVIGLFLIPVLSIDFFSVEVLAVLVVTVIYLWVYSTLQVHTVAVIAAQLLTVAAVSHAFITFEANSILTLYGTLITHLGLQVFMNRWLRQAHKEIYQVSNAVSLIVTGILYLASNVFLFETGYPLSFALVLMLHSAYYAMYLKAPYVFHLTAITWYLIAGHILFEFGADEILWLIVLMAIGIVQVFSAYASFNKDMRQAFVRVGLVGVGLMTLGSMVFAIGEFQWIEGLSVTIVIAVLLMYIGLAVYAYFAYAESNAESRLLPPITHLITPAVAVVAYFMSVGAEWHFIAASLALITGGLFLMAFRNLRRMELVYLISASIYPTVIHILLGFNMPNESYPIALSIMSVILFLLEAGFPILPEDTHRHRKYTALIATALVSFSAFSLAIDNNTTTMHIAGWVSGYTLIALLWLGRALFNRRGWEYLIGIVALAQYYWHIYFLQITVNETVFSNPQWYFAAAATFALLMSIRERQRGSDESLVMWLEIGSALLFLLPTYGQSFNSGSLLYFLLALVYSLLFVALGVMFRRRLLQQIGSVGLIIAVFLQTREFFLGLDRWLVVGIIGFALIAVALYLSIRRRGEKRKAQ